MRTYERNGVHVDQCTECRGIFLDRGELEKLVDAETSWHGGAPEAPAAPAAPPAAAAAPSAAAQGGGLGAIVGEVLQQAKAAKSGGGDRGYDDRAYDNRGYDNRGGYPYKGKKKKSFLDELFG